MDNEKTTLVGPTGPKGPVGPNDGAYALFKARSAASKIKEAIGFLCVGYSSQFDLLAEDHPLARAMKALEDFERTHALSCANEEPQLHLYTTDDHGARFEELKKKYDWFEGRTRRVLHE